MKKLIILGSTGSIGTQTLDCVRAHLDLFRVSALSAGKNIDLLEKQIREFSPSFVAVADTSCAIRLSERIAGTSTVVLSGENGILRLMDETESDMVVNGIVGMAGMMPTYHAVSKGITVALANKESMVVAGNIIMELSRRNNVRILPVDSEHSAIFQCLNGICPTEDDISGKDSRKKLKKIILTASGGAFFGKSDDELRNMKAADALRHPNWSMGAKITIDCATMFNKGFEILEAAHIFDLPPDRIEVLIHRESVIHSMICFCDNSVLAQLGVPDMRVPIQYALTYPSRLESPAKELDLVQTAKLTFFRPDARSQRVMDLCRNAFNCRGTATAVLNAANECAVEEFLKGNIPFTEIADRVESALIAHNNISDPTIEQIIQADIDTRHTVFR